MLYRKWRKSKNWRRIKYTNAKTKTWIKNIATNWNNWSFSLNNNWWKLCFNFARNSKIAKIIEWKINKRTIRKKKLNYSIKLRIG